ncbi:MAG: hypothetical protein C4293_16635 [Nitrospiraceae bacterium]
MASPAQGQTRVIPALTVTERYDTNVFFIPGGLPLEDYVTTVTPQVRVEHNGRLLSGDAQLTVVGEAYVKNPGLNYIAPTGSFNANLDELIGQYNKRIKLSVSDFLTVTPRPPAFFAPETGSVLPADFIRGIQAVRTNSVINIGVINAGYILSPTASLVGAYQHQYMHFGTSFAPAPGQGLFQTIFQTLSAGPQVKLTTRDTVTGSFLYSHMQFSQGDTFSSTFETKGATATWQRGLSPKLTLTLGGGATVVTGIDQILYLANASLEWKERSTTTTINYSRSIFPSFFIAALPLVSQVVGVSVTHRFTDRLTANGNLNYAKNESTPDPVLVFDSYGASGNVTYAITRTVSATASYRYNRFKSDFFGSGFDFDRHVISLSIRAEWP